MEGHLCVKCLSETCPNTGYNTSIAKCTAYIPPKPITNADRIRAMTDEELDQFLGEVQWDTANYCGGVTQKQEYPLPEQKGAWLDWLKRSASDDCC